MDKYLFRGKQIVSNEWVEGYFYKAKYYRDDTELCCYITTPYPNEYNRPSDDCMVIPETVGQFTGLTDKNGVKIFEGDIIKERIWDEVCVGTFRKIDKISVVIFKKGMFSYNTQPMNNLTIEVIGNIHDNPELLNS